MYKLYILHDDFYGNIEVFTEKETEHYIQYQEPGKKTYITKRGKLEELVGTYPYGDNFITYRLFEKEIEITL